MCTLHDYSKAPPNNYFYEYEGHLLADLSYFEVRSIFWTRKLCLGKATFTWNDLSLLVWDDYGGLTTKSLKRYRKRKDKKKGKAGGKEAKTLTQSRNYSWKYEFTAKFWLRQGWGQATPEYDTLANWIFQTERTWETAGTERSFWPFPEAGHEILTWEAPSHPKRKGASFLQRRRDSERRQNEQAVLSLPQFTGYTWLIPHLSFHIFPWLPHLHQTQYQNTQVYLLLHVFTPFMRMKVHVSRKTFIR